jgi:protein-S-isoprenylcysteine O-methyltransferase Ste14
VLICSVIVGAAIGFPLALDWTVAAIPWFRPQVTIAGFALILLGGGLRWLAILTLGRYFKFDVAVRSAQPVVQSGPYSFVRHPAYSGTLLSLFGIGLALANWASIIAILAGVFIGLLSLPPVLWSQRRDRAYTPRNGCDARSLRVSDSGSIRVPPSIQGGPQRSHAS